MAMPPPCNSSPLKRRREHDSVEDQSDPFAKLKSSGGGGGGVASLTDRELFDMWRAIRGGKTYSSKEEEDKKFSMFKEAILDKPSTHPHEDQSDPFAKLKSPGGVASLTDREIFDMWRAMCGVESYPSQEDEDKAYNNFLQNIRDAPANEEQYACNCHDYADLSKEEAAEIFRTWGWDKRNLYNAYIFKSNIEKWPRYAKYVYSD